MFLSKLIKEKKGTLHFSLIDPDRQTQQELASRVKTCRAFGTDAFVVGGSSAFSQELLDKSVQTIKAAVDLPVILFPNSAAALSEYADYIFFMSLLNTDDPRFLIKEQVLAAPFIEMTSIQPISMGYIVISMSRQPTTIERRVNLNILRQRDVACEQGDNPNAHCHSKPCRHCHKVCITIEERSDEELPPIDRRFHQLRHNKPSCVLYPTSRRTTRCSRSRT